MRALFSILYLHLLTVSGGSEVEVYSDEEDRGRYGRARQGGNVSRGRRGYSRYVSLILKKHFVSSIIE